MQNPSNYLEIYATNFQKIQECADVIVNGIKTVMASERIGRIDQIKGRAKSIERFKVKALKKTKGGSYKYENPLTAIQDQIGVRIVTFYLSDVENITKVIRSYYKSIEITDKHPDNHDAFSYTGVHFILSIPEEERIWGEEKFMPSFFELQIKTMFQHAWAESEHDLDYKTENELSYEDKRLIAYSAAQAWGADKIFEQLVKQYLGSNSS